MVVRIRDMVASHILRLFRWAHLSETRQKIAHRSRETDTLGSAKK